jgi:hypothetical protein
VPAYEEEEGDSSSQSDEDVKVNEMRVAISYIAFKIKTSDR